MFRKLALLLFAGVALTSPQTTNETIRADEVVKAIMARSATGLYSSWDQKNLEKLGDSSAVAVTKVVGDHVPSSNEVKQILFIINASFEAPKVIVVADDRRPRTALFVLARLQSLDVPADLRKEIDDTRIALLNTSNE